MLKQSLINAWKNIHLSFGSKMRLSPGLRKLTNRIARVLRVCLKLSSRYCLVNSFFSVLNFFFILTKRGENLCNLLSSVKRFFVKRILNTKISLCINHHVFACFICFASLHFYSDNWSDNIICHFLILGKYSDTCYIMISWLSNYLSFQRDIIFRGSIQKKVFKNY